MYICDVPFHVHSDGAKIEISTDRHSIECGKNLTFTCKMEEYTHTVTWMYENDVIPIAQCIEKSCSINPNYVGKYEFKYNVDQGVFNLTIINMSRIAIGRKYLCSNGYEDAYKIISLGGKDFFYVFFISCILFYKNTINIRL